MPQAPEPPPAGRPSDGYRIGVDIGGTFVDAVLFDFQNAQLHAFKLPTTPEDPAQGVIEAMRRLGIPAGEVAEFVHGTTLGLNAILERKGTRVGILTNAGFEDIFEIGRGNLDFADMYRFDYPPAERIVERRHVRGVAGRIDAWGAEVEPLDLPGLLAAAESLLDEGCRALAVSFLHAYANPAHEQAAVAALGEAFPDLDISSGAALANEYREYERTSTAVLDAYIKPVLKRYLGRIAGGLAAMGFRGRSYIMNSSGGALTFAMGEAAPIATVMSGPAGGVAGALHVARVADRRRVLSVDIGGTSLDACLIVDFAPTDVFEAAVDHLPILQPIFDIRNLGAGGGSIARVENRLLRVGPESAGAVPGPACYRRGGDLATVTDAALVLGYLDPAGFMGGEMEVAADLARRALETHVCTPLGIDVAAAARSILAVVVSRTSSSIKEMLLERGLDPRDFTLLAFGGCGPLLGPMIQRELGMPELLVPPLPSVFSAWGMMASDLTFHESESVLAPASAAVVAGLRRQAAALAARSVGEFRRRVGDGVDPGIRHHVRMRFIGQEHTLSIDLLPEDTAESLFERFSGVHHARFGHSFDEPAEIVSVTVRLTLTTRKPEISARLLHGQETGLDAVRMHDLAGGRPCRAPRLRRSELAPGRVLPGPLLVPDEGSTLVVHGDQEVEMAANGILAVRPGGTA